MGDPSTFPVLWQWSYSSTQLAEALGCPRSVPWELVAQHEEWALRNHGQTLARLAERGGLAPSELLSVVEGRPWRSMLMEDAVDAVKRLVAAFEPTPDPKESTE